MRYTLVALTSLLSTIHALTITSPTSGATVDPSQPITIKWTSTAADPSTFNLVFINNGADQTLASNVQTSGLSYTVPANTILTYGAGFTIAAISSSGNNLASSGNFILNYGGSTIVTNNGQLSLVTSSTAAPASTASSISFDTSGVAGQSVTATYLSGSSSGTAVTAVTASSTDSTRPFTTHGIQSFSGTTLMTSFSSTASSTGGSTTTSAHATSSSASASASANAQSRNVVGKEVISAAGILAGLVALLA